MSLPSLRLLNRVLPWCWHAWPWTVSRGGQTSRPSHFENKSGHEEEELEADQEMDTIQKEIDFIKTLDFISQYSLYVFGILCLFFNALFPFFQGSYHAYCRFWFLYDLYTINCKFNFPEKMNWNSFVFDLSRHLNLLFERTRTQIPLNFIIIFLLKGMWQRILKLMK